MSVTMVCQTQTLLKDIGCVAMPPSSINVQRYHPQDKQQIRQIYLSAQKSIISSAFITGLQTSYVVVPALLIAQMVVMATSSLWNATVWLLLISAVVYASYHIKFMMHITHSLDTDLANIEDYYTMDGSSFWVVKCDGRVAGFLGVVSRNQNTAELQRLTVAPEYRRQGIAEAMCRHAIQMYTRMKYKRLILECTESHNAAKNLYRKLGFIVMDCVTSPYALSAVTLEHHTLYLAPMSG